MFLKKVIISMVGKWALNKVQFLKIILSMIGKWALGQNQVLPQENHCLEKKQNYQHGP